MKGIFLVLLEYVKKSARTLLRGNLLQAKSRAPIQPNADYDDDDDANNLSRLHNLSFLNEFLYHWSFCF